MTTYLFGPVLAMVALTFAVLLTLFRHRIGEMRERRIRPQALATARDAARELEHTAAADNLRNLFELPVLFYVLFALLPASGVATGPFILGGWLYVALRATHSAIHCTYNRVRHRFIAYVASTLVLLGLWLMFAIKLAQQ